MKVAYAIDDPRELPIIVAWHDLKYANMLPKDEKSDDPNEYHKDEHVYGFDIDKAYESVNREMFLDHREMFLDHRPLFYTNILL